MKKKIIIGLSLFFGIAVMICAIIFVVFKSKTVSVDNFSSTTGTVESYEVKGNRINITFTSGATYYFGTTAITMVGKEDLIGILDDQPEIFICFLESREIISLSQGNMMIIVIDDFVAKYEQQYKSLANKWLLIGIGALVGYGICMFYVHKKFAYEKKLKK